MREPYSGLKRRGMRIPFRGRRGLNENKVNGSHKADGHLLAEP